MTAFDYTRSRATADRLIARYGQTGQLLVYTKTGTYDPTVTYPATACTLVVLEYESREVDGTRVLATDKKVLLKATGLSAAPKTSDRLSIGGVEHSIVRVEPLSPGGTVVIYTLQVRR